jgi:shikimate dehydrogenase
VRISGKPRLYGLIGHPVGHSLSPFILNRAFAESGIDAVYAAFEVLEDRFPAAARSLAAFGIAGANVTYPYKERILEYATRRSPIVDSVLAANTLLISPAVLEAHNTDAPGAVEAVREIGGVAPTGKNVVIFGSGGAGRAAAYGFLDAGALKVTFAVRDPSRSVARLEALRRAFADRVAVPLPAHGSPNLIAQSVEEADIIVNATPVGMEGLEARKPAGGELIEEDRIEARHCCFEFVYHPRSTPFLAAASRRGARTVDGLALLVAQAAETFRLWTGREFSLKSMYDAVVVEYSRRQS